MAATKLMVIRHAEKPDTYNGKSYAGIDAGGSADPESLVTLGWERAGALVSLFSPARGPLQNAELATPQILYSSDDKKPGKAEGKGDKDEGPSKRPHQTITALAAKLGLTIDKSFAKKDYADMVTDALGRAGIVLIAWQHQDIPSIGGEILKQTGSTGIALPSKWPGDRYDLVWVFDRASGRGPITNFVQVPQLLLAGDQRSVIPT